MCVCPQYQNQCLGNGSQGRTRMSDSHARTGTFPQMRVTAGDTACSMKGVLELLQLRLLQLSHFMICQRQLC